MKKNNLIFAGLFFLFPIFSVNSQINTSVGGASSILPNSPTSNTNVGIGTSNPSEKLEVVGNLKAETGYFYKSLPNGQTFASWDERNIKSQVLSAGTIIYPLNQSKTFNFFDFPASNFNPTPEVFFSIGDRNNNARLSFNAEQGAGGMLRLFDLSNELNFRVNDDGIGNVFIDMPKANSRIVIAGWGDYLPEHKLVVRGSSKIEGNILTDANIGIGTNSFTDGSDTYRLSVNGSVRANRVRVYTTWADYVFENDYKLPTLNEVEDHINKKGHLIDIPSAKEVEANGIELGEMNKLLLQKVEELTLYIIQMNKELENVKEQLKELKDEN